MKTRRSLGLLVALVLALHLGCAKAPPNLSPPAVQAFYKTQVVKNLDLLRDFAIGAEATTPKVISTASARTVVQSHKSIVTVMLAADAGWQAAVTSGLEEAEKALPPNDRQKVAPYVSLVKAALQEIH